METETSNINTFYHGCIMEAAAGEKLRLVANFSFFSRGYFDRFPSRFDEFPARAYWCAPSRVLARFRGSQNRPHRGQRLYSFTASPVHLPKLCFHQLLNSRRNEPKINTRPFATLASREFFFFFNKIPPHNDCRNRHNFSNFFAIQI